MKTILLFFIAFVLTTSTCIAQPKLENTLLWKISGNSLVEESYLFGTYHTEHYSFLDSVYGFWDAFHSAKNIVGETIYAQDSTTSSNPFSALSEKDLLLPKDSSYRVLYNEEDYNIVNDFMQTNKLIPVPLEQVPFKPSLLYMLTAYKTRATISLTSNELMDSWIILRGQQEGKNLIQLDDETSIMQLSLSVFSFFKPLRTQAQTLLTIAKNEKNLAYFNRHIEESYRNQSLHEMEKLNEVTKSISEDFNNSLLINRNTYWMEKIPGILKSGSSLIAVGVRHLVGDDGLINMLRKEGYTVEPVTQNKN